jgi:hypothetical protein
MRPRKRRRREVLRQLRECALTIELGLNHSLTRRQSATRLAVQAKSAPSPARGHIDILRVPPIMRVVAGERSLWRRTTEKARFASR